VTPEPYAALYAEKCRLGLDLKYREQELARIRVQAAEAAQVAERQRAHLQRRIDALVRKVRQQHAQLHPPVEYWGDRDGMWGWRCNGAAGCEGWIGSEEHSEDAARVAYEDHARHEHRSQ
jgi:hypothetical protein